MVQIFKQKSLNFLIEVKQHGKFRLFPSKYSRFGHNKIYTHGQINLAFFLLFLPVLQMDLLSSQFLKINQVHESSNNINILHLTISSIIQLFFLKIVANTNLLCCLSNKIKTVPFISGYIKFVMSEQACHQDLQDKRYALK